MLTQIDTAKPGSMYRLSRSRTVELAAGKGRASTDWLECFKGHGSVSVGLLARGSRVGYYPWATLSL